MTSLLVDAITLDNMSAFTFNLDLLLFLFFFFARIFFNEYIVYYNLLIFVTSFAIYDAIILFCILSLLVSRVLRPFPPCYSIVFLNCVPVFTVVIRLRLLPDESIIQDRGRMGDKTSPIFLSDTKKNNDATFHTIHP